MRTTASHGPAKKFRSRAPNFMKAAPKATRRRAASPESSADLASYQGSLMTLHQDNSNRRLMHPAPQARLASANPFMSRGSPGAPPPPPSTFIGMGQQQVRLQALKCDDEEAYLKLLNQQQMAAPQMRQQQPTAAFGAVSQSSQAPAGGFAMGGYRTRSAQPNGMFLASGSPPRAPALSHPMPLLANYQQELSAAVSVPLPEEVGFTAKWANKSSTEKVLALIEYQEFEGSWPTGNEEIAAILGFEIPQPPTNADAKVWITLLIICFLEQKNAAEEGTWGMVVEKARDWVTSNVQTGLDKLEEAATKIVGKN